MLRWIISRDRFLPIDRYLFGASTDFIISELNYLSMEDICRLDTAVTNTAAQAIWLNILRASNHRTIDNHEHSHESFRWVIERGTSPEYLIASGRGVKSVNVSILQDLDMPSLRNVWFCYSSIADEEILLIADGCPNLSKKISLVDCCGITDVSVKELVSYCYQLTFISNDGCYSITDGAI